MAKTAIVTGGGGFLGSHLCKKLLSLNYKVTAIDNLNTGRLCNIKELIDNENFTFIEHDIIEPIDIKADWIFNFACPASPPRYQKDPIYTLKTNVIGSLNMLDLAKKYNVSII